MYMGARHYMGGIGRFLSVDPAFLSVGDEQKFQERYKRNLQAHLTNPQALNSYSYALNNPLRFKDENGEIAPLIVAGAIWGAAEIGLSIYDGFSTYQTVTNPNVSISEKAGSVGLFALGLVGPGGGYKTIGSKVDDGVGVIKSAINKVDDIKNFTSTNFRKNLVERTGINPVGHDAHHMLPQKFEKQFSDAGINIHDPQYGAWWKNSAAGGSHQTNANSYNKSWENFFNQNTNATKDQINNFADQLAGQYGIDFKISQ